MTHFKSYLTKTSLISYAIPFLVLLFVAVACNRQINENTEPTFTEENWLEKSTNNDKAREYKTETAQATAPTKNKYLYDEFYGEKHFTANYISEYGKRFSELTFLIDTNYIEACPGHYSQIAFYVTAPTKPSITYNRISGIGKIRCMRGIEKSGTQTLGSYKFRAKIEEIGTHIIEIVASVGTKGKDDYAEKIHQITIEASCKNTCPPFTEKIIPSYNIPRILPYDVYITSSENSTSHKNNCKTAIDIAFKDSTNQAINYQIFEGISPFIENPISKQLHQNPTPTFSGKGNGQQNGLCNGVYYIELTDVANGCRTHKAFEVEEGELVSEDQHIFEIDTVYEERNGRKYMIVNNPHPNIKYVKYGENDYFKVLFNKDIAEKYKMNSEEEIEFVKKLISFNEQYDSLEIRTSGTIKVYHKGIWVQNFRIKQHKRFVEGRYKNDLNVNASNLISKSKAVEIIKQEAENMDFEFLDSVELIKKMEYLKDFNKNLKIFSNLDTTTSFFIKKFDNQPYLPFYGYTLFKKNPYESDKHFYVNALSGKVHKIDD